MDFDPSPRVEELRERIRAFLDEHVYPVELEALRALDEEVRAGVPYPEILVEIRSRARVEGLWNLFMPDERYGAGLTNWEYGLLCEEMGRSPAIAPMAFNCAAPDTGNMEILAEHGTDEQRERWLQPLLDGEIRSCFSMTEPEVSGSDPTTLRTRAELDGDEWVITGHKWFTSGAVGAAVAIVMCVSEPDAHPYARASMILVPTDTPGFDLVRPVSVMGHDGGPGHCEIRYEDCRVPAANLLGERGAGFVIAQDRLGPGRIHHCMRAIGTAERAIEMMCRRANEREAFGGKLADKQFVQDFIAKSRMETDQARLLTLLAAWKMDTAGKRAARQQISMIKVVAANVVMDVLDRAIQVHGALGMSDDTPLAGMWRFSRMLKVADGPDEVHKMVIARRELNRAAKAAQAEAEGEPGASSRQSAGAQPATPATATASKGT
jgi:acyl-CoA dehydrogenase